MGFSKPALAVALIFAAYLNLSVRSSWAARATPEFIRVRGTHLELHGAPYHFLGTNFWYGMNLGASGPRGDRPRLLRELDRLKALGVDNLRILAASEGPDSEPWRITPALQTSPGKYDSDLLNGLDFLLNEMKRRDMHAVICLGNFWPWSGGMSQYLQWYGAGSIPYPPPQPGGSWSTYQTYTQQFYTNERAMSAADQLVRTLVSRTNLLTGRKYAQDPTIMAWELANEPRGISNTAAFERWIEHTSGLIKSLDPRHLVTTGEEGETPAPATAGVDFVANHRFKSIDYATVHIWAQNWDWYDPARHDATYTQAVDKMRAYFKDHLAKAKLLGKPMVVEEFGLGRDLGSYAPSALTEVRDRYYKEVFELVYQAALAGEPVAGVNFWAWAGEARPQNPGGGYWKSGDAFLGDPPHEAQGWYSVYDTDRSTQAIISSYARKLRNQSSTR
jgi:mannan endo-1,4-beta-mannosidase